MKVHLILRAAWRLTAGALFLAATASPALAGHHSGSSHSGASAHAGVSHSSGGHSSRSSFSGGRSFAGGSRGGNPPSDSGSPRAGSGNFGGGGNSGGGGGNTAATPSGGGTSGGVPSPGSNSSDRGHNGGNYSGNHGGHSGGSHGGYTGGGHYGGGHYTNHGGGWYGGGFGNRGYYYPTLWGSVFFGYPYPYWWYGPWGWGSASGGYYQRDDHDDQGALDLDLSPADTQVYVNGDYIGTVDDFDGWPQYLWLDAGTYDIVFYREGYKTLARQVTIYRGLVVDWDDKLEKGPSTRPEDLATKVHERRDARLDQDREMREKAERGGSPTWRDRVRDERGRQASASPAPGATDGPRGDYRSTSRLVLTVEPQDASVYLDGRFLGNGEDLARLSAGVLVDPGPHTLSVVRPGHRPEERKFEVKVDDKVELNIVLQNE